MRIARAATLGLVLGVWGVPSLASAGPPSAGAEKVLSRPRKAPKSKKVDKANKTMSQCDKTVGPDVNLDDAIAALPDGGVLCLGPGRYAVNAVVDKSLTLRGTGAGPGDVTLDGGGRASVISLGGGKPRVTLEHLTITGGANRDGGGGVRMYIDGDLVLRDVIVRGNRAEGFGGGGLFVGKGRATVERSRFIENSGGVGAAIIVDVIGKLTLRSSLVADNTGKSSAVFVREVAELHVEHSTIAGNQAAAGIELRGTTVSAPTVEIRDSIVAGPAAVANGPRLPGTVKASRSLFSGEKVGVTDEGGNADGEPKFAGSGTEPYRPLGGSPAIGIARPGSTPDLTGFPSGTTAGALEPAN